MTEDIYPEYLEWFREKAKPDRLPKSREGMFGTFLDSQTMAEEPEFALDQAFFVTWIRPKDSMSNRAEWFIFSEFDTLPWDENGEDVLPAEKAQYERLLST